MAQWIRNPATGTYLADPTALTSLGGFTGADHGQIGTYICTSTVEPIPDCVSVGGTPVFVELSPADFGVIGEAMFLGVPVAGVTESESALPGLTLEGGGQIAVAIIALWAVAWAFVQFKKVLQES